MTSGARKTLDRLSIFAIFHGNFIFCPHDILFGRARLGSGRFNPMALYIKKADAHLRVYAFHGRFTAGKRRSLQEEKVEVDYKHPKRV
jgi:hypothetical protein